MTLRHKIIAVLSYGILAAAGLYFGVRLYWTLQPSKVLDVLNNPAPVRPQEINPEATIIVSPILCKHLEARAYVRRTLISKTSKVLLPDYGNILPKGCSSPELAVIIPGNTPDGTYHLEYEITYHINPIKDDVENWQTKEFVVKHVPPLPDSVGTTSNIQVTPLQPTSNTTTTKSTTTTTTNDGNGNTTSTTSNNPQPGLIQQVLKFIGLIK